MSPLLADARRIGRAVRDGFAAVGVYLGARLYLASAVPRECVTDPYAFCGFLWNIGLLLDAAEVGVLAVLALGAARVWWSRVETTPRAAR